MTITSMDNSNIDFNVRECLEHGDYEGAMECIVRGLSILAKEDYIALCNLVDTSLKGDEGLKILQEKRFKEHDRELARIKRLKTRRLEIEETQRKRFESQLMNAKKFLIWAGHYSNNMTDAQIIQLSEDLVPKALSREQHSKSIRKLELSINEDHFLTNSYRRTYYRVTYCYICGSKLDNALDKECGRCGWIVCSCGACGCGYKGV
jgi:hypothetical protein